MKPIVEASVKIFAKQLPAQQINSYSVHSFDSTLVGCSAKFLTFDMQVGRKSKDETHKYNNHIKFTIGLKGQLLEKVKFYD